MAATNRHPVVFATFAEDDEQLSHVLILAESIRAFAGKYQDAPIHLYLPNERLETADRRTLSRLAELKVAIGHSSAPREALEYYFARKVFAAAEAESALGAKSEILVWLDEDTIVLREPSALLLDSKVAFGYRPVMHNRSGSLYDQPPGQFWGRIYKMLDIDDAALFPMTTPADHQKIRPYFNAGLLAVRPERRLLAQWAGSFRTLYQDPALQEMCRDDVTRRLFLHQTALVSVLTLLNREEMIEFPVQYNYPMLFRLMYGGLEDFDSIEDVVTLRYDIYFRDPAPDWADKLSGPADKIEWLKGRLGKL